MMARNSSSSSPGPFFSNQGEVCVGEGVEGRACFLLASSIRKASRLENTQERVRQTVEGREKAVRYSVYHLVIDSGPLMTAFGHDPLQDAGMWIRVGNCGR